MAIIKADRAGGVVPLDLTSLRQEPEARPAVFEDVTPRPAAATAPVPELPPPPPPPPAPPPPPIVEVPEDLLAAFYEDVINRGRDEGLAHANTELEAERRALQERYAAALDRLEAVSRQLVDRNRLHVIRLSVRVAERLVRHHLSAHPDHLLGLVREAMAELEERDEVVIHCAQPDYVFLTARRGELSQGLGEAFRVQVVVDGSLQVGDFRVETRNGAVDGGIGRRIAEAESALLSPDGEGSDAP
jgi:flagellar biosynthesis/type III secretory pathway protein FliH